MDSFDRFWSAYPKKRAKKGAGKAFAKLTPEDQAAAILDVSKRRMADADWLKDGGKYIPYPATYLNRAAWLDEWESDRDSAPATASGCRYLD